MQNVTWSRLVRFEETLVQPEIPGKTCTTLISWSADAISLLDWSPILFTACTGVTQYLTPPYYLHISNQSCSSSNNRPTLSLLTQTGTSATAAGLNQPAPTVVPAVHKAQKARGAFPVAFLTAFISAPQKISLQIPTTATWQQCFLQISCSDQSLLDRWQLIQNKWGRTDTSWMEVTGKKQSGRFAPGEDRHFYMTIKQSDTQTSTCRWRHWTWLMFQGKLRSEQPIAM